MLEAFSLSDMGCVRTNNEDYCLIDAERGLYVLADGMGGAKAGEHASRIADRATRYIVQLTGLTYEAANGLLFEVIEYVEPRMKSDQAYPPVVGMAVLRARDKLTNEAAEKRLLAKE